jgi:hypothetical protein
LAITDIDRYDLCRPAAKQNVGEPSGRGAGVEAPSGGDRQSRERL